MEIEAWFNENKGFKKDIKGCNEKMLIEHLNEL